MAIPITIISGFLGAGKTTLVNNLLASAPQRLAVLVNDFAALNIDAELIRTIEPNQIALTNGCVCCTLRDDLVAAALQLAALDPPPERIVLETSGVADPYGVMEAFYAPGLAERLSVDSTVCVVDAEQFPGLSYADGELAIDQAAVSDLVLLNKCDLVSVRAADAVEATLLGALPAMRITRTARADVPSAVLFGIEPDRRSAPVHSPENRSHHHEPSYASWSWQSHQSLDLHRFRQVVAALPRAVLRAKGILRFNECPSERAIFQLVGKRSSITFEPDDWTEGTSSLVFIGAAKTFDPRSLSPLFADLLEPSEAELTS
jgi:G3E family GTPase